MPEAYLYYKHTNEPKGSGELIRTFGDITLYGKLITLILREVWFNWNMKTYKFKTGAKQKGLFIM